jgi:leader peptidase (prepilin peptidase) / N-methyltransferase
MPEFTLDVLISASILIPILIWIGWVDAKRFVIPNPANLALLMSGLALSAVTGSLPFVEAFLGVIAGGAVFLAIRQLHLKLRGVAGLGLGDVKFVAAAGSWIGLFGLPWLVLFAAISALSLLVGIHAVRGGVTSQTRIAFGPHLALGLFLTWIFIRLELL